MATAARRRTRPAPKPPIPEEEIGNLFADDALTPYSMEFTVKGVKTFFFNCPNVDAYLAGDARRKAGVKRLDTPPDPEEKVWRHDGVLAVPGREFIKAMAEMSRGLPDPTKSGAKSMRSVLPTALSAHEDYCKFFQLNYEGDEVPFTTWDEVDVRLVKYRGTTMAPTRRPVLYAGWMAKVQIDCIWPEVFAPADIATLVNRGGLRGIGDATRIGEGRYVVVNVEAPTEISWT